MRPSGKNGRLALLLENNVDLTLHLLVDNNDRGMVSFACEKAPQLTFSSHGLPCVAPFADLRIRSGAELVENFNK